MTKLAEALSQTKISTLRRAAIPGPAVCQDILDPRPQCVSGPIRHACSLTMSVLHLDHSLERNCIGDEGVTKLAEVLSQTKITTLK